MDIGAEISKKIQMAITAKLKELDAYVDDELPDYIMIMVANKKTESQMTDALSLFLAGNTKTFTSWLHNLLSTLRKGKVDKGQSSGPDNEPVQTKNPVREAAKKTSIVKEPKYSEDTKTTNQSVISKPQAEAVITIDSEMHDLFDEELMAESSAAEFMAPELSYHEKVVPRATEKVSPKVVEHELSNKAKLESTRADSNKKKVQWTKVDKGLKRKSGDHSHETSKAKKDKTSTKAEKSDRKSKAHKLSQKSIKHISSNHDLKNQKPTREWDRGKDSDKMTRSKNQSRHRDQKFYSDSDGETTKTGKMSSAVSQIPHESEFVSESDSDDDKRSKVSSRISYPKRTMKLPLNKQANKALFMKAVNAAEKSVKTSQALPETSEDPTSSDLSKVGQRLKKRHAYADNDVRRKLQIKKAIGEALQSELVGVSRKNQTRSNVRPSNRVNKSDRIESGPSKKSKLTAGRTSKPKIAAEMTDATSFPKTDQRKFIIQSKASQDHVAAVAFDSREALHISSPEMNNNTKKTLIKVSSSEITASNTVVSNTKPSPNFIVTMDGVIRSNHSKEISEEDRKAARMKKFNMEKITIEPPKKNLLATEENSTTALQELEKMKEKILEVKKESNRLKEMQTKLAAVQAGQTHIQPAPATDQRSVVVANVHYSTTERQLSDYFSICGKVTRATILKDNHTGHPKGLAYLEFDDATAVTSALALNNTQLNNRIIRVTMKQPAAPTTPYQPQRGYYRSYRGRTTRAYPTRFRQARFSRFGVPKLATRNKTWVNPALTELGK